MTSTQTKVFFCRCLVFASLLIVIYLWTIRRSSLQVLPCPNLFQERVLQVSRFSISIKVSFWFIHNEPFYVYGKSCHVKWKRSTWSPVCVKTDDTAVFAEGTCVSRGTSECYRPYPNFLDITHLGEEDRKDCNVVTFQLPGCKRWEQEPPRTMEGKEGNN